MKALILAAGLGTRLRPITDVFPKCMVPVNGITIIQKQLTNLINNGVTDVGVITGYKSEILIKHIMDIGFNKFVTILHNPQYDKTNNMYSLFLGKDFVKNQDFLLMNGDVFFDELIITDFLSNSYPNLIACDRGNYLKESMKITYSNGRIMSISKNINTIDSYGTSIDLYKFSSKVNPILFNIIHDRLFIKKDTNSWSEVAINELFQYEIFKPMDINGRWVEIDNHEDLSLAEELFTL